MRRVNIILKQCIDSYQLKMRVNNMRYGDIEISEETLKPYTEHLGSRKDETTLINERNRNKHMKEYMQDLRKSRSAKKRLDTIAKSKEVDVLNEEDIENIEIPEDDSFDEDYI